QRKHWRSKVRQSRSAGFLSTRCPLEEARKRRRIGETEILRTSGPGRLWRRLAGGIGGRPGFRMWFEQRHTQHKDAAARRQARGAAQPCGVARLRRATVGEAV